MFARISAKFLFFGGRGGMRLFWRRPIGPGARFCLNRHIGCRRCLCAGRCHLVGAGGALGPD